MGYFRKFINKRMLIILLLAFSLGQTKNQSQTVLIDPTGDGGFESGATFAANAATPVRAVNMTLSNYCKEEGALKSDFKQLNKHPNYFC